MFDIGFTELMVIGVVALVVVGPERLPKLARTAGQWVGRLNRYVAQVKQDVSRDIKLDELRKMQQEMKDSAQQYEIMAGDATRQVEETVEQGASSISKVMQAMSVTDGGLTMQEYEKIQAEKAAAAKTAESSTVATIAAPEQIGPSLPSTESAPALSAATETTVTAMPVAQVPVATPVSHESRST